MLALFKKEINMLIEFRTENYRSIKEELVFSMIANNRIRTNKDNVTEVEKYNLLKSAVIYGANASGKTNILEAISYARYFIINSSKDKQAEEPTGVEPFLLNSDTENKPTSFEFVFLIENSKYRYGFALTNEQIEAEWLYKADKEKEQCLFTRELQQIIVKKGFKEGSGLETRVRENALFLSVVANFNGEISRKLLKWFAIDFMPIINDEMPDFITYKILKDNEPQTETFLNVLKKLDLFIDDMKIVPTEISSLPLEIQKKITSMAQKGEKIELPPEIRTLHKKYNKNHEFESMVEFSLDDQESGGTKRLFTILGPILLALQEGFILSIDELELKLHPLLMEFIIKLFNSSKYNKKNAQLIFTTHNSNLLKNTLLRKDQIWFTQKNKYGETSLYSLNDFKDVRTNETSFDKNYLEGKYGGVPLIIDDYFFKNECEN